MWTDTGDGNPPSILFDSATPRPADGAVGAPGSFPDLNLDQVVAAVTAGREEYGLEPFFFAPLREVASVTYRQDVFRDLDGAPLFDRVCAFAQRLRSMRDDLAQAERLRYRYQKERWFLDAVDAYCVAVTRLVDDLAEAPLRSQGLLRFRDDAAGYVHSGAFRALVEDTGRLRRALGQVLYCVHIHGRRVEVSRYDEQADHSAEVLCTFEKFRQQGPLKDYRTQYRAWPDMNHVEERIHDLVVEAAAPSRRGVQPHERHRRGGLGQLPRVVQRVVRRHQRAGRLRDRPAGDPGSPRSRRQGRFRHPPL